MNVIVSNKQKEIIDNANIDAIKDLNGLFNVDDLINKFKNYFFSKMILDATSVVDFASKPVLTTLANEIGAEKLIILLPSTPEPPLEFKKLLIELKIYNFTNNIDDVIRFIEKPNTYEDAIKSTNDAFNNDVYVDNSIKEDDNMQTSEDYQNNSDDTGDYDIPHNQSSLGDILNSLNVTNSANNNSVDNNKPIAPMDNNLLNSFNYQSTTTDFPSDNNYTEENVDLNPNINYAENSENHEAGNDFSQDENKNVFLVSDDFNGFNSNEEVEKPKKIVIGFKNVTTHAGCTSLIYMLHKTLHNMKKDVLSVEIGKNDFRLFRDNKMISINSDIEKIISDANTDVILVDLNNYENTGVCNEVLYLVEPSTIKLNELMATNKNVFKELKNCKVLLNKSLLSSNDIRTLESEAGLVFFDNIEPLNDRKYNDSIGELIKLLGIK